MRLLIFIALLYVVWRLVKTVLPTAGGTHRTATPGSDADVDVMVQDPVCGVYFPRREGVVLQRNGEETWFCSNDCKNKYITNNT